MSKEELNSMSDEEKILYLNENKNNTDELEKIEVIRSFPTDDLKLKCIDYLLTDESKAAITYSMTSEENKFRLINLLADEKVITSAVIELSDNKFKMIMLNKITTSSYKNDIISSLKGYDEDKTKYLNLVQSEKDRAIIIANLSDVEVKKQCLKDIKGFYNRCLIVATIKIDEIKNKFISQVKDAGIKTLLIASLEDKNVRNTLLGINNNKYQEFYLQDKMKLGIEIETEGEKTTEAYLISQFMDGWISKRDTSLKNGVENTSPILTNSKKDIEDLKCVCKVLKDLGQNTTDNCAGHIHIDADYLKTKDAYKNLIELWSNNEELIFLLSNQKGEIYRNNVSEYAKPISKKVQESIEAGDFEGYEQFTKDEFIEKIKNFQKSTKGINERGYGINFLNVGHEEGKINTIEFRIPNGTIDIDTWIENIAFFGGMIAVSQKISDISKIGDKERIEEEKRLLEKFKYLRKEDITEKQRLDLLLELCVPSEIKQAFIERCEENSKVLSNNPKTYEKIGNMIAKRPVVLNVKQNINENINEITQKKKSILETTKEAFEDITDIGEINRQVSEINMRQQEREKLAENGNNKSIYKE